MGQPIYTLYEKLITFLQKENMSLGLVYGKMGNCVYFYYLSSIYNDTNYKKIAEKLLDEVFENIDTINAIDVKNGLSRIGLAIDYLIKNNNVKGNVNAILNDADDIIFRNLSYSKYYDKSDSLSLIQILYYLCIRLKSQKQGSESNYLYKELIIEIINQLYEHLPQDYHEEPYTYDLDYILPQLLFLLSEIYQLDFYNYRLIKIIEELSYKVLSIFPILHSNKLYLRWGIDKLNQQIQNRDWDKQIVLLKEQINIDHIFNYEQKDKNIFFNDGITSIFYFINTLSKYFSQEQISKIKEQTINKSTLQRSGYC